MEKSGESFETFEKLSNDEMIPAVRDRSTVDNNVRHKSASNSPAKDEVLLGPDGNAGIDGTPDVFTTSRARRSYVQPLSADSKGSIQKLYDEGCFKSVDSTADDSDDGLQRSCDGMEDDDIMLLGQTLHDVGSEATEGPSEFRMLRRMTAGGYAYSDGVPANIRFRRKSLSMKGGEGEDDESPQPAVDTVSAHLQLYHQESDDQPAPPPLSFWRRSSNGGQTLDNGSGGEGAANGEIERSLPPGVVVRRLSATGRTSTTKAPTEKRMSEASLELFDDEVLDDISNGGLGLSFPLAASCWKRIRSGLLFTQDIDTLAHTEEMIAEKNENPPRTANLHNSFVDIDLEQPTRTRSSSDDENLLPPAPPAPRKIALQKVSEQYSVRYQQLPASDDKEEVHRRYCFMASFCLSIMGAMIIVFLNSRSVHDAGTQNHSSFNSTKNIPNTSLLMRQSLEPTPTPNAPLLEAAVVPSQSPYEDVSEKMLPTTYPTPPPVDNSSLPKNFTSRCVDSTKSFSKDPERNHTCAWLSKQAPLRLSAYCSFSPNVERMCPVTCQTCDDNRSIAGTVSESYRLAHSSQSRGKKNMMQQKSQSSPDLLMSEAATEDGD